MLPGARVSALSVTKPVTARGVRSAKSVSRILARYLSNDRR
jgi:hypothetical protein